MRKSLKSTLFLLEASLKDMHILKVVADERDLESRCMQLVLDMVSHRNERGRS